MHKIHKTIGISHFQIKTLPRSACAKWVFWCSRLTSDSMLFIPYGSFDRNAARLATISSISFSIAPSAATSDELLSNPISNEIIKFLANWKNEVKFKEIGVLTSTRKSNIELLLQLSMTVFQLQFLLTNA